MDDGGGRDRSDAGAPLIFSLSRAGNLIWPILLHASSDPSIFLQVTHSDGTPLAAFAGLGNIVVIAVGLVLLIFIRGRVTPPQHVAAAV